MRKLFYAFLLVLFYLLIITIPGITLYLISCFLGDKGYLIFLIVAVIVIFVYELFKKLRKNKS